MNHRLIPLKVLAVLVVFGTGVVSAVEPSGLSTMATERTALDQLAGQSVDIAPWAYAWRADLAVQEKPEAYFIPRRLERMDQVYRTAITALSPDQLKSIHYDMPDLLKPLLPQPKGRLQAGLLWIGRLANYQVELHWPAGVQEIPAPESVEVRVYPTQFGWFGWTVDERLAKPQVSADQRTWTYPGGSPTEMVAAFYEDGKNPSGVVSAVPSIRVVSPNVGAWKRLDLEMEWGFQAGTEKSDFDGSLESSMAIVGPVSSLANDKGTAVTGPHAWQSRAAGDVRRGIVVPLLCAPSACPGLDSRVTVWTETSGFTFRPCDLDNGPILIPEHGIFVTKVGSGKTARQFAAELAAKHLKGIRQMTREHREAASWDEVMQEVRLSRCPAGTVVPPFPKVPDPPMEIQLPDPRWTDAWRTASFQLKGKHMWGNLALEVARVAHEMDLVGLHDEAAAIYDYFLQAPGAKPDGDYADGAGALEWAKSMRHDMGYSHDGTHASTGRLLYGMADRYFLTGDQEWFQQHRVRMQAAADWIIRQRTLYMKDIPNRQDLLAAGLMPPCMLGDYVLPSCDWRWYYLDNALSLQGLRRFADALMDFDPEAARTYGDAADAYCHDIRRAVDREAALSPVRLGRDGMYRSFLPVAAYSRGAMLNLDLGVHRRLKDDKIVGVLADMLVKLDAYCDTLIGALPLADLFGALDASDTRMDGTLNAMEEAGTSPSAVRELEEVRKAKGLPTDDSWFWTSYGAGLSKVSYAANLYLLQDDVPNFLRFWMNSYAIDVGADGKLWEWDPGHSSQYADCTDPDNGTAGWFLENFRNLLVMEEGPSLWVARATPRTWLEQGKTIAVHNAPTYFGPLAYEIVSDADHGKITATIEMPNRNPLTSLRLRLRHPKSSPIKSVLVNGGPWTDFDLAKEVISLHDVAGTVKVESRY